MADRKGRASRMAALALPCGVLSGGCSSSPPDPELEQAVLDFVREAQRPAGGEYTEPEAQARADLSQAVLSVAAREEDRAEELLAQHAYRMRQAREVTLVVPATVPDSRGWGLYAVRAGGLPLAVEVPHPRADLRTEHLGAALAERLAAQHLLVAGARRASADQAADVARRPASLFAAVHEALAQRGLPAVQLHGFAESTSPRNDVVVSPGSAPLSPLVEQVAEELAAAGFRTCRAWREKCGPLAGLRNVQGIASAEAGVAFVHVEVSRAVRDDAGRRAAVVEALAAAVEEVLAEAERG